MKYHIIKTVLLASVLMGFFQGVALASSQLIVGIRSDSKTLEFANTEGLPEGTLVELWKLWAAKTGTEVKLVTVFDNSILPLLEEGTVDIIANAENTPELYYSDSYFTHDYYLFSLKNLHLKTTEQFPLHIGVNEKDNAFIASAIPPSAQVSSYSTYQNMLNDLLSGKIDYLIANDTNLNFSINGLDLLKFYYPEKPFYPHHVRAGTLTQKKHLLEDVNVGMQAITDYERQAIVNKWSPSMVGYRFSWEMIGLSAAVLLSIIITIIIWLMNIKLKRQVANATQSLTREKAAIIREREMAQSYLDIAGVMFGTLNRQGDITLMNKKGHQILGYPEGELLGRNWFDVCLPEAIRPEIKEVFKRQMSGDFKPLEFYENAVLNSSGEERMIAFHNTLLRDDNEICGALFSGEDITKRKQAEKHRLELEIELRQKHKMEAVGYMAGGMAHNFNNGLAIVLGNLEMAQRKISETEKVKKYLENAQAAILHSRDLVSKIITYSRKGVQHTTPTQLTKIINETLYLIQSTLPTTVVVKKDFDPDSDRALFNADPSQFQEVLINLCNNAVQAMDEKGELKISLELVDLEQKNIPAQYDCLPGHYAKLSVQDSGCGMPAEMLDKIFDPFYSTKEEYEGAGMGLSTVQGIVARHGGIIKVNSIPDQGTTFNLYFPIIEQTHIDEPAAENTTLPKGTERILFVDDEEMLASLGEQLLTEMGYQVSMITNSTEALKMFIANADRFDLVITDQTMPNLSGKDLIEEIKKIRPDTPTILCTGDSSKINEGAAAELGISAYMMKPLDLPKLAQTVRRVLDGES
ncbi:MAG: ATP-binding protein [Desulfuromusa sp.]|nr:ATP-binding protein [Desulfuromusa sp.]